MTIFPYRSVACLSLISGNLNFALVNRRPHRTIMIYGGDAKCRINIDIAISPRRPVATLTVSR